MDVNADERLAAGDAQHQVGALGPDAVQSQQHIAVARHDAAVFLHGLAGDGVDCLGLGFVEGTRRNEAVDLLDRQPLDASLLHFSAT